MELDIVKLIGDYGVTIIIASIFLTLAYNSFKNQNELIKKQFEDNMEYQKKYQSEVLETIVLIKEKIVNGHLNVDDLRIQVRLHWLKIVNIYKNEMLRYIIQNNIKKNISQIEIETDKKIIDMLNRAMELLRNQTNTFNLINIIDLLKQETKSMNDICIELLKSNISDCENGDCVDYKELARIIENHINHSESEAIVKINEMKL